uniref:Secreted peptide n=1 Tax=Anopheles braziliensis TaxID=58242 RepID=A0A2M3ZLN0_9DIPT
MWIFCAVALSSSMLLRAWSVMSSSDFFVCVRISFVLVAALLASSFISAFSLPITHSSPWRPFPALVLMFFVNTSSM